jgi:general secretion pathway protein K
MRKTHPVRSPRSTLRSGFALLAVLAVIVGVAVLALGISLVGREALAAAQNRIRLRRSSWWAEDCLERARAAAADALRLSPDTAWVRLDRVLAASPMMAEADCDVELRAAGSALDVDDADEGELRSLFAAMGVPSAVADSLTDALLDWRDADDVPRPLGAERSWYVGNGRHPPRNGPLASARELALVRGFDVVAGIDSVLDVEPGRLSLEHAPLVVLAALPGSSPELLARIAGRRARGERVGDLTQLVATLSADARHELVTHLPELLGLTASEPEAWIVTARGAADLPQPRALIEVRLVRAGARAAIIRRRSAP